MTAQTAHTTPTALTADHKTDHTADAIAALPAGARFEHHGPGPERSALRQAIDAAQRSPEAQALAPLRQAARQSAASALRTQALARRLVQDVRQAPQTDGRASRVQSLMQAYDLSSSEGVALMCLAEALLRIPDAATRNALIRDKIGAGHWRRDAQRHKGLFVQAASWGLVVAGRWVSPPTDAGVRAALLRLMSQGGMPAVRQGVQLAMRLLGEQFVVGQTIAQALQRAQKMQAQGFAYSYDMLGEAALTASCAARYAQAYEQAIHAIGRAANGQGVLGGPGISIKLSALHPRYGRAQRERVLGELVPRVRHLAALARRYDMGLNIDAEEADRLDVSLDVLQALCDAPELQGWQGLGFVVQAYQKACPQVIDCLIDMAQRSGRRLMVRLVKGAYWDTEIKRAQEAGLSDYPVYTRKHHTDVAYLACARRLLAAPGAVYPQFATHNAHTVAALVQMGHELQGDFAPGHYEFQCLHGMGEALYQQVVGPLQRPCRIYAPVGTHQSLLAYLVRRLLENGANSSFVNRMADPQVGVDALVQDPLERTEQGDAQEAPSMGQPHPRIGLPEHLYGPQRRNARGLDWAHEPTLGHWADAMQNSGPQSPLEVQPLLAASAESTAPTAPITAAAPAPSAQRSVLCNPADRRDVLGHVQSTSAPAVSAAVQAACDAAPHWAATLPAQRAQVLDQAAQLLHEHGPQLLALLVREAGKTWPHALAEWREAIDFLRHNAQQVRRDFAPHTHVPLGAVVCISPWNFPLAIFVGQAAAALAAGNTVLAKPAEQTPAVAALAVRLLHQAGVPTAALQLLPGKGAEVGAQLVADARVQGVWFTGSTEVARLLQKALATRLNTHGQSVPLVAETGGQNCMVVDASALLEQTAQDAIASAFEAAGQRCSALRVLCVQSDVADRLIELLKGAMDELHMGPPAQLRVDVGPVIDATAQARIEAHVSALQAQGCPVYRSGRHSADELAHGHFVSPTLIEIADIGQLGREVFGPVLHVVRYAQHALPQLLQAIEGTGYALTLGVQSRIQSTIAQVIAHTHAGNVYVNRSMVGAVVGVQPFGGEGLSGTGPKAGGPLYLLRHLAACPPDAARASVRHCAQAAQAEQSQQPPKPPQPLPALLALHHWALAHAHSQLAQQCTQCAAHSPAGQEVLLPGPTGERNAYTVQARAQVLCLTGEQASAQADILTQLAAVLAVGGHALWPLRWQALHAQLPPLVQSQVTLHTPHGQLAAQAALLHGDADCALHWQALLAQRPGPIVTLTVLPPGHTQVPLERLVSERSISTHTAAAGGNASLMMLGG